MTLFCKKLVKIINFKRSNKFYSILKIFAVSVYIYRLPDHHYAVQSQECSSNDQLLRLPPVLRPVASVA